MVVEFFVKIGGLGIDHLDFVLKLSFGLFLFLDLILESLEFLPERFVLFFIAGLDSQDVLIDIAAISEILVHFVKTSLLFVLLVLEKFQLELKKLDFLLKRIDVLVLNIFLSLSLQLPQMLLEVLRSSSLFPLSLILESRIPFVFFIFVDSY